MEGIAQILLVGGALLFAAILVGALSQRLGVPVLLVFLVAGMVAGEDGPGRIEFDDSELALLVGNLSLALILLDGGVRTRRSTFRIALAPGTVLATLGVLVTAVLTGIVARFAFDVGWPVALLLGAVVGSTDAAAVFAMLKAGGTRLSDRIAHTLEIESGINDPMAALLTMLLVGYLALPGETTPLAVATQIVRQFGFGAVLGIALGWVIDRALGAVHLDDGLRALLLCAGGVAVFGATAAVGGSGFLAVYIAGVVVGNGRGRTTAGLYQALDGMAWLAQSAMFLLLGLLVAPHRLLNTGVPAVAVAAALMLVARPVAVALSLSPFRFSLREITFVSWVGLRGAVPIVLALFPLIAGVEQARLVFDVAFVVVLTSLLFQGTTVGKLARLLRVTLAPRGSELARAPIEDPATSYELVQYRLGPTSLLAGVAATAIELPASAVLLLVVRNGKPLASLGDAALAAGDVVVLAAPDEATARLAQLFRDDWARSQDDVGGELALDGTARFADIAALYGIAPLPAGLERATLDEAIRRTLRFTAVEGDKVVIGGVGFVVRETRGARVVTAAILLGRRSAPGTNMR